MAAPKFADELQRANGVNVGSVLQMFRLEVLSLQCH